MMRSRASGQMKLLQHAELQVTLHNRQLARVFEARFACFLTRDRKHLLTLCLSPRLMRSADLERASKEPVQALLGERFRGENKLFFMSFLLGLEPSTASPSKSQCCALKIYSGELKNCRAVVSRSTTQIPGSPMSWAQTRKSKLRCTSVSTWPANLTWRRFQNA